MFLELDSLYSRFWFPKDLGRISKAMSCKLLPHLDQGTSCMFRSPRSPSLAPPNPRLNPPAPANWSTPTCLTARAPAWWIRVTVSVLRSPTIHGSELFEWGSYPVCFFSHHLFFFFFKQLYMIFLRLLNQNLVLWSICSGQLCISISVLCQMHGLFTVISFLAQFGVPLQSKILDFFTCSVEGPKFSLFV